MPQVSYEEFDAKVPKQESEIVGLLGLLENRLEKIDNAVLRISEKIALILSPEPPTEIPQPEEPSIESKLGTMLHGLSEKADYIHHRIQDVETRIKL